MADMNIQLGPQVLEVSPLQIHPSLPNLVEMVQGRRSSVAGWWQADGPQMLDLAVCQPDLAYRMALASSAAADLRGRQAFFPVYRPSPRPLWAQRNDQSRSPFQGKRMARQ